MSNNVDIESAKNAINACKNSINYSYSKGIVDSNGISTSSWDANCNQVYKNALSKLINIRYKELEEELDNCLVILDNMSEVKALEGNSSYYGSEIESKKYELQELKSIVEKSGTPNNQYEARQLMENKNKIRQLENEIQDLINEKAAVDRRINQYDL